MRNLPTLDFMLYRISFTYFLPDLSYSVIQKLHGSVLHWQHTDILPCNCKINIKLLAGKLLDLGSFLMKPAIQSYLCLPLCDQHTKMKSRQSCQDDYFILHWRPFSGNFHTWLLQHVSNMGLTMCIEIIITRGTRTKGFKLLSVVTWAGLGVKF